jgi:hypothetical protein
MGLPTFFRALLHYDFSGFHTDFFKKVIDN